MSPERTGHGGPIGMTISVARPASPIDSSIKPINVLSEPHAHSLLSTGYGSPSAADRLQQTLDKSDTKALSDTKPDTTELDQPQLRHHSTESSSSIRIATAAAREIVAGLFNRHKKSLNSLSDEASMLSRSPKSSSSLESPTPIECLEDDYLYNTASDSATLRSPRHRKSRTGATNDSHSRQNEPELPAMSCKSISSFGSSSTIKKLSTLSAGGSSQGSSVQRLVDDKQYPFSLFTLTQNRCENRGKNKRIAMGQKSQVPAPRINLEDVFMSSASPSDTQAPLQSIQENSATKNNHHSPVGALIRKNSVCRSISSVDESLAISCRSSIHGSGAAALNSVLTSPKFTRTHRVTSLSPIDYKLPETDGYVSFPPYVPSSYFSTSLANLFGRNESSTSLALDGKDTEERVQEGFSKPSLRRTLKHLVTHQRSGSVSPQSTTLSEVGEEAEGFSSPQY